MGSTNSNVTHNGVSEVSQLGNYSNSQTTNSQNSNSKISEAIEKLKKINKRGEDLYKELIDSKFNDNVHIKCSKFYMPCKTPQSFT